MSTNMTSLTGHEVDTMGPRAGKKLYTLPVGIFKVGSAQGTLLKHILKYSLIIQL